MQQERTKSSIINIIFSLLVFILDFILKFLIRTVFVRFLAIELLGLNGLFTNILQVLSLTELGIGSALTFSMYKPMAQNDKEKVIALYNFYKKIYTIIVAIILVLGLILTPFLKYLISGEVPAQINLYVVYLIYLFHTAFSYLSAHKKSLLLAAQRNDLNSKSEIIKTLFLSIGQLVVLLLFKNYYAYIIFLPLSVILEYVITSVIVSKKFPEICKTKEKYIVDSETKKEIKVNTFALIFHKIGGTLVSSTDNILISSILGLAVLGLYSNYYLIFASLVLFLNTILNALKGSIGNLIAKESPNNIESVYNRMNFIYTWVVTLFTICLGLLYQPFIKLWVGEDFLFSNTTMILIVVSFYLNVSKSMTYSFKECAGLLKQDQYRAVFEVVVNLTCSIVFAQLWGINGIILGTILSAVLGPIITEPYVVYKYLFKKSPVKYYLKYILNFCATCIIFVFVGYLCNFVTLVGIWALVVKLLICLTATNIVYLLMTFWTKDFRNSVKWIKEILTLRKKTSSNK